METDINLSQFRAISTLPQIFGQANSFQVRSRGERADFHAT